MNCKKLWKEKEGERSYRAARNCHVKDNLGGAIEII